MHCFVQFGENDTPEAVSLGLDGLRVETDGSWDDLLRPLVGVPLGFIFLLHDIAKNEPLLDAMDRTGFDPSRSFVEPFNELEKGQVTERIYIDGVNAVYRDCKARGFLDRGLRIISGGLANLSMGSQGFYRRVVPELEPDVIIGAHSYPHGTQEHREQTYWPGYDSLEDQLDSFLAICAGRPAFITEAGWHTAEETQGWQVRPDGPDPDPFPDITPPRKIRLTDEQVYQYLVADLQLWASRPQILGAVVYQWRDGLTDTYIDRFGLHTSDGAPKRQLDAVRDWRV
jgi:hypothetical protein